MSILKVQEIQHTNATSALTINTSGLIIPKSVAFQVEATDTDQSISAGTNTVVQWETATLDTGSYWDTTNHRYTPQIAGWYLFGGVLRFATSIGSFINSRLRKNGSTISQIQFNTGSDATDVFSNGAFSIPNHMVQLNGSTDYVDVSFASENATTLHDSASEASVFWGMLVHKT